MTERTPSGRSPDERLSLSPDDMREFGHRVVDLLVEHFETLPDKPVTRSGTPEELASIAHEPIPEHGQSFDAVLSRLRDDVFSRIMHVDHPRFFAFVPSPSNYVSVMAEALVAGFNVYAGTWLEGAGAAAVEQATIDWLRRLCGMPDTAGGLFVSGASLANINALAVARTVRLGGPDPRGVVYCSDQTHSSIQRGLQVLGFTPTQLRTLPTDDRWRLDLAVLRDAVAADRRAGLEPFCVVANAGTTNTGAIDPLRPLGAWCRAEQLWLHVDGAYGAAAVLCDEGRALLDGLGEVDSLTLDPHKWLFQPYETGCLLVRDADTLRATFELIPEYLKDAVGDERQINYSFRGIQLTRSFRALKVWLSFQVFGRQAFAAAVGRGLALARHAEATLRSMADWEVVAPATLAVVAFRYAPRESTPAAQDAWNRALVDALIADGHAMVSSTVIAGRVVIRMCPINPRTTESDIETTLRLLDALARRNSSSPVR